MTNLKVLPFAGIHTFDAEDIDDAEAGIDYQKDDHSDVVIDVLPKRRRGRPPGSKGRVNEDHDITMSDFSYMRAVIQGIDQRKAAARYLSAKPNFTSSGYREYESKLRGILQRTIKVLLSESDQTEAHEKLEILDSPALLAVALGPSLDEFAARWDADFYTENELQEMYVLEFGGSLDPAHVEANMDAGSILKKKIIAINWLSDKIAKKPQGSDPLELWIDASLIQQLRAHGVISIGNLLDWVNIKGRTFYLHLKGVGLTRARRLVLWLIDNEESIGRRLNRRVRFQTIDTTMATDRVLIDHSHEIQDVQAVQEFGIVPMERFSWPTALYGQNGVFRSNGPNTFGATNDREALQAWFVTLESTSSPDTVISYKRAIERLVLWAIVEQHTALSSLVTESFVGFREFLRNPPPHWCSKFPSIKESQDWRPLRGPMKEASIQQTFSAISALFTVLNSCGYLITNAVASVRTSAKRDLRMDVMRSFAEEDLESIKRTMDEIEDGPNKRRLRALILLLQTGGFRRGEAIRLRYGHLSPIRKDNRLSEMWVAKFVGKGGVERQVPIKSDTYAALQAHYQDRIDLTTRHKVIDVNGEIKMTKATLAAYIDCPLEDTPLLSILDDKVAAGRDATEGETSGNARVKPNLDGALSNARIYSILKEFFRKVSERRDLVVGHADFEKASTHWLRHTFGHQSMIASNGDLAAIQQILGHSDIATTGIYLKANMDSRAAVIEAMTPAV